MKVTFIVGLYTRVNVYTFAFAFALRFLTLFLVRNDQVKKDLECGTRRTHSGTFSIFLFFSERMASRIAINSGVRSVPKQNP